MNDFFDFLDLIEAYNEPHRHYHNFTHIAQMFEWAKEYEIQLTDEQKLAILFHDVVYSVGKKSFSNEHLSAICAYDYCHEKYGNEFAKTVKRIILDTENHIPTIELSKSVLDLDLLPIALSETYEENGRKIRMEFKDYSDKEFNNGRIEWIESMLNRQRIFTGCFANCDFEEYARFNLTNELMKRKKNAYNYK